MRLPFIKLTTALCCFALFAQAQSEDSLFMQAAVAKLRDSKTYTLQVAAAMPAERYVFKPTPAEMSFGEQALHLAQNTGWLCSSYLLAGKNPVTDQDGLHTDKAAILNLLTKTYDYAIQVLQSFDPKGLKDTVSFFAGTKNKLQIINLMNDHQTHHRAQMIVYLRLNAIKPPDYVGW